MASEHAKVVAILRTADSSERRVYPKWLHAGGSAPPHERIFSRSASTRRSADASANAWCGSGAISFEKFPFFGRVRRKRVGRFADRRRYCLRSTVLAGRVAKARISLSE